MFIRRFALIILAVIVIAAFIFLNQIGRTIKSAVEYYGPDILQTSVTLKDADLSLLDGHITLEGLDIGQPKGYGDGPLVAFDRFSLQLPRRNFLPELSGNPLIIDSVLIERPIFDIRFIDGKSNITALSEQFPPSSDSAPSEQTITIHNLKISAPELRFATSGLVDFDQKIHLEGFELNNLGTDEKGLAPKEIARHIMAVLEPQVKKAIASAGIQSLLDAQTKEKLEALKDKASEQLDKSKEKLKDAIGDTNADKIESGLKGLFGKKKKTTESETETKP